MGRKALGRALAGICMLIGVLALPGAALAAECTSTWTGAVSGEWQVAENWSPEEVPNSSDVACIPKEKTAQVVSGTNFVELLQGEGRVAILGGSLAIMGAEQSHIQRLRVGGGALRGPGELLVTEFLHADGGSMEAAGRTVIGSGASGHVDPVEEGPGLRMTEQRELEVKGLLEIGGLGGQMNAIEGSSISVFSAGELAVKSPEGGVRGSDGITLDNAGALVVNGEGAGNGLGAGTGALPKLVNTGTVLKSSGSETALIGFKVDNEDLVESKSGTLAFFAGGNSGQENLDSWVSAEKAQVAFAEGTFTFGEKVAMSGTILGSQGASLKAHRFEAEEAEVWLSESSLEINGAEKESRFQLLATAGGSIDLIDKGKLIADDLWVESEGSLDAGNDVLISAESFYQEEATTTVGADSSVQSDSPYVAGGRFQVGPNGDLDLGSFYQEEGETTLGAGSTVKFSSPFIEQGPFDIGVNSTVDLGRFFIQAGTVTVGAGSSLSAEDTYLEAGSVEIGGNADYAVEDDLYVEEGALDVSTDASVHALNGYLQAGTLSGAGNLVAKKLGWESTVMSGSGSTRITEFGTIGADESEAATLRQRRLITQGLFSLNGSTLLMANGARLQNEAEFAANSEASAFGAQIRIAPSSTSNPRIINRHEFNKEKGSGTTTVTVPFENNGAINEFSGTLHIVNRLGVPPSERFGCRGYCGDPIEIATGDFGESQTDIAVGGLGIGLELTRSYSALAAASAASPGIFGYGWFISFGDRLDFEEEGKRITVVRANGNTVPFTSDGKGGFEPPVWSKDTLTGSAETGYVYKGPTQIEYGFAPSGALQSVTDRNGNESILSYTEAGKLKTIEDPAGREINLSYNGEGLVEKAEDPMGHLVQYTYEGEELASVTMPGEEEPRWQFDYDASHRITSMIDGRGGEVENEYDAEGRVLSQTDPAGRTLSFFYDGFHTRYTNEGTGAVTDLWFNSNNQPTSITRGYGTEDATTERFTYDDSGRQLSRTDGNGHTTTYTYNAAGDRTSVTDAEENKTEWAYNATHDVISETTPKGQTTTIVRDAAGNPETISQPAPGEATQTISFDFDPLGQLKGITDPLERTWSFEYDAKGNLEAETNPEGDTRSWGYDENSEVTSVVSPRGNEEGAEPSEFTTTIQRDPRGRPEKVIDPLGHESEFDYDGNGNLESVTNARGKTTEFAYNGVDELVETKKPNGAVVKTEYDDDGQVVGQIDGNEEKTTYVRNVLGEPIEVIDPLSRKTTQQFDDAGNLLTVIDPMERVTAYEYDDADRLEEVAYSGEATADVNFEYDADGNLTRMVDGSGESTYVYDQLGRLEETTNGHGDTIAYEYDLANQQEKIVYPNGKDVDRAFDDAGRLESVTDWLGKTTTFVHDPDSNLEEIQFPVPTGNVDEYAYDRAGQMISADFKKGAESLASIAYERDPLGQVEAMVSAGLPGPEEETYEYDDNNRLVKAGAEAFEYDNADNPTKIPGSTNIFDAASQLETGTATSYTYNELGERTKETAASSEIQFARHFGGESSGPGRLAAPAGVAIDAEGNAWIADTAHNRIQVFSPSGQFLRQFGTTGSGNGQLRSPRGLAFGPGGNLFVVDTANNRVQIFDSEGEYLGKFGSVGTEAGQFRGLLDLALDAEGNVWTLEGGGFLSNNRIQKFSPEGTFISQFGSTGSQDGQLKSARGIALDAAGNVWIADTANNRIQAFKPSGEFIRKFGTPGEANGELRSPQDIAFDSEGDLWVADSGNGRMQRFTSEGAYLSQFGTPGPNPGQFAEPQALALDAQGDLWVADTGNNRVVESSTTEFIREFGGQGSGPGHLVAPSGAAIDASGNVWVADTGHNRIQKFNANGEFVSQFGTAGSGNGQLRSPRAVAIDAQGDLWVADTGNDRVQEFKPNGEFLRAFGTSGTGNGQFKRLQGIAVDPEGDIWTVELGAEIFAKPRVQEFTSAGTFIKQFGALGAENGQFKEPQGIALDAAGNVWIADTANNRIQAFKPSGEFIRKFGTLGEANGELKSPRALAFDSEGDIWVVDSGNNRLQRFTSEGEYLAQFGASGPNDGQFSEPKGIALDATGNIWVADTGNDRVQESSATEFIRHFGGESSGPGRLAAPAGVALDAEGNAWVADTAHNRIQVFGPKGQFLRQFGTTGSGNGQLRSPRGLAFDATGNLFVADSGNHRVQIFNSKSEYVGKFGAEGTGAGQFKGLQDLALDAAGNVWTVEGGVFLGPNRIQKFSPEGTFISQFGSTGSEDGQLKSARGIALDAAGNVWVADTANNRVQAFKPSGEFIGKFGTLGEGNGQLKSPQDLTVDGEGNLWVADSGNGRMQRFTSEGTYLSQLGTPGPNSGQFAEPQALALDAQGDLWVADTGNNRVQEWQWPIDTTYGYDQAGHLTSVQRSGKGETPQLMQAFAYDGAGLMASRTSGSVTQQMAWDLSAPLPLLLNDGVNSYVYGPYGLPITQIDGEEKPTHLHHDQLGSTRLLTDSTGKASASFTYTAYGELAAKTGTATTPLGYAGQYTDADTGLQYLRARFYDPATAQFLTRDPIEDLTGEPYVYASSNPLQYSDSAGLSAVVPVPVAPSCVIGPCGAAATYCALSAGCRDVVSGAAEDLVNSIIGGDEDASDDADAESAAPAPGEEKVCIPGEPYRGSAAPDAWWKDQGQRRGITRGEVRERLHDIKRGAGLGATDDVAIGKTGDVYDERTGELIGSLTQPHN